MSGVYLIVVLSLVVAIALGFGAYNVGKNYWEGVGKRNGESPKTAVYGALGLFLVLFGSFFIAIVVEVM